MTSQRTGKRGSYMEFTVRKALPGDSQPLTRLSFVAKRYWNYPEEYFNIWKNELTISPDYIGKNIVF